MRTWKALWLTLLLNSGLSALVFFAAKIAIADSSFDVVLLGDSETANFRLPPGHRLHEAIERDDPGARVWNFARPGSFTGDYYLLLQKALFLGIKPERVVALYSPGKFHYRAGIPGARVLKPPLRFYYEDANLKWLPLNAEGFAYWRTLAPDDKKEAIIQKPVLLTTGYYEILSEIWERQFVWPYSRRKMEKIGPERAAYRERNARAGSRDWESAFMAVRDEDFENFIQARDFELLIANLNERGIPLLVVLFPTGNPELLEKYVSQEAKNNLEYAHLQMVRWLGRRGVTTIDLGGPGEAVHFPPSAWDDLHHLKDPAAIAYVARRIARAVTNRQGGKEGPG